MATTADFRHWFEHEIWALRYVRMALETVPAEAKSDPRFQRIIDLIAHICVCRSNWLLRFNDENAVVADWQPKETRIELLDPTIDAIENGWNAFFVETSDDELHRDFEFLGTDGVNRFRFNVALQCIQMNGHGAYHRGQIAMLIDQLGGVVDDTDYLFWAVERDSMYGQISI